MKPTPEEIEAFDEENEADIHEWENGDLGKNPNHVSVLPEKESAELRAGIREGLRRRMKPISIRLPPEMIAELKRLAMSEGISYQIYVRALLHRHIQHQQSCDNKETHR